MAKRLLDDREFGGNGGDGFDLLDHGVGHCAKCVGLRGRGVRVHHGAAFVAAHANRQIDRNFAQERHAQGFGRSLPAAVREDVRAFLAVRAEE